MWAAQTKDAREEKIQAELKKRRDEERQVEEMRKMMYLSGQGKMPDNFSAPAPGDSVEAKSMSSTMRYEQKDLVDEQRRRKAMVKQGHRAAADALNADADDLDDDDEDDEAPEGTEKRAPLAKSRYKEDEWLLGHCSVWGSWYSKEESEKTGRWGFGCCKVTEHDAPCPVAEELAKAAEDAAKASEAQGLPPSGHRSKRRRRADAAAARAAAAAAAVVAGDAAEAPSADAEEEAPRAPIRDEDLMDRRMLEAVERRKEAEKRKHESLEEKEQGKKSGYLADLLSEPSQVGDSEKAAPAEEDGKSRGGFLFKRLKAQA